MAFRMDPFEYRSRFLTLMDAEEVAKYDSWIATLTREDHEAVLADIESHFQFTEGMQVLDAGAGTGALCSALALVPGLSVTALDPSPAMLDRLRAHPLHARLESVRGFCDHPSDRSLFPADRFDVIASRQLANGLFDPLEAFRNWQAWLRPGGAVVLIDGWYDRTAWTGGWTELVDILPLSACRTTATVPYLLEVVGFRIEFAGPTEATNRLPSTRTPRYLVVARKAGPE